MEWSCGMIVTVVQAFKLSIRRPVSLKKGCVIDTGLIQTSFCNYDCWKDQAHVWGYFFLKVLLLAFCSWISQRSMTHKYKYKNNFYRVVYVSLHPNVMHPEPRSTLSKPAAVRGRRFTRFPCCVHVQLHSNLVKSVYYNYLKASQA